MQNTIPKKKMAIIYNFDGILSIKTIMNSNFLNILHIDAPGFWCEVENVANKNIMDYELAFLYVLLSRAQQSNVEITKELLKSYGKNIKLQIGVDTWFDRINEYANSKNIEISHFAISNGIAEFIDGCSIAKYFQAIFANRYMYNAAKKAIWPALNVNSINKEQFLLRINKGVDEINKQSGVNKYIAISEKAIPFSNIILLGDVITDVPLLKVAKNYGCYTIGVYDTALNTSLAKGLQDANRLTYASFKDFSENTEMDKDIKSLIDNIALNGKYED